MKELLISLFGVYEPVVDLDGVPLQGLASLDFPYIFGCIAFLILLYGLIRLLGGLLNAK